MFQLDRDLTPKAVAGVPLIILVLPDNGGETPLPMGLCQRNGISLVAQRIAHSLQLYDMTRLDHFRVFWSIGQFLIQKRPLFMEDGRKALAIPFSQP